MSASQIINISWSVTGVPTDFDSTPVLRDPTAAYGVQTVPPGTIIVAAGTAMTRTSAGAYTYTVTGLTPGQTYQYSIEKVYLGNKTWTVKTFTAVSDVALNAYFTWQQFENRYGLKNIIVASNKDLTQNTGTTTSPIPPGQPNFYAVQDSFNVGTDRFHRAMYGGVLAVPLVFSGNVVPNDISRIVMHIAWCDLYGARGLEENSRKQATHKFLVELQEGRDTITAMRSGHLQVPEALQATDASMTAVSFKDVRQALGQFRYFDGSPEFRWSW